MTEPHLSIKLRCMESDAVHGWVAVLDVDARDPGRQVRAALVLNEKELREMFADVLRAIDAFEVLP